MLLQFALMGSAYMEKVQGVSRPKVGLVNIGAEETKGLELQIKTYELLRHAPVNFTGNVEARGLPLGEVDVAVADGFTGNIILKTTEGMGKFFSAELKGMVKSFPGVLGGPVPGEQAAGAEEKVRLQRDGRRSAAGPAEAGDQGPWQFECQGVQKRRASGHGLL